MEQDEGSAERVHGKSSGYLCVKKTLEKVRQWYYWIHTRSELTDGANSVTPVQYAEVSGPKT
jgi:transposase InsO family protein